MDGKCILYIEDNDTNRMLVRRVLTAEGYTLLEAADGPAGVRAAEEHLPDLILMDINLPELDGYQVTSHLKSNPQLSHIPVIAITANVMQGDREKSLDAGCDGYIQKPIDIDRLPEQVANFITRSRHAH